MKYLNLHNILLISLAGIAGTLTMTAFMYLFSLLLGKQMKVPKILGTMLTGKTRDTGHVSDSLFSIIIGEIAHYAVGVLFAITYLILWHFGIGNPDLLYGLLFGFVSGLIGMAVWKFFLAAHSDPPKVPVPTYLFFLLLAHIIFGIITFLVYRWLEAL